MAYYDFCPRYVGQSKSCAWAQWQRWGKYILSIIGQAADLSDKIIDTGNGEELGPMMQTVVYGKLKTFV